MEPENIRFGGGATETLLHPVVALWLLVAIVLILVRPRDRAITPFLLAFFTIPIGQVVLLGGIHFTALRILILAGLLRIVIAKSSSSVRIFTGKFNRLDLAVVLWTVSSLVVICLQWMNVQALVKNLGDFLDALGGYMVVRFLILDRSSIYRTAKVMAILCLIQGLCMTNEQITHINVFGLVGGNPVVVTVRDGHLRSQGVLGCINAGVFAGTLLPLFIWLWKERKGRWWAWAGIAGAMAIVVTSSASTSVLAAAASFMGLAFWRMRRHMRFFRWGLALILVGLHLVMHAPVWSLIARIDLTGSSSGYHRYYLIDNLVRHFSDWWLLGYRNYGEWGWDMWDTCNQFVDVALKGGLITLILYILIFRQGFGFIGRARKWVNGDKKQEWLLWCLGAALFSNVVSSFGINYMAQLLMGLFPLLACISIASLEARQVKMQRVKGSSSQVFASGPGVSTVDLAVGAANKEAEPAPSL